MKKIPFIDLRPAHRALESKILAVFRSAVRRNDFILGEEVRRFEEEFARSGRYRHAVGVSSGTSALFLALRAVGINSGDGVLTSPFTFYATAAAVVYAGGRPEFVDIDPGTLNLDPARLEKARTRRTRGVLPVHLFGQPCDMERIGRFARRHRLRVVEDACQAHGARFRGRTVGRWGDAGCFSFYPTKNLGGMGDGGMIVTESADLAEKLRRLRNCGRPPGASYRHDELGYNERLDNLQAAALRVKLPRLMEWTRQRRLLADVYREELGNCPAVPLRETKGAGSVFHVFTVRAPDRDGLRDHLRRHGIDSAVFYPTPLHLQPAFRYLGYGPGDFPEAEKAAGEVVSLPLYPGLSLSAVRRVAAAVRGFYKSS
jgi:dTDP-4-amino-4,6-dideoxygalactose transaminase